MNLTSCPELYPRACCAAACRNKARYTLYRPNGLPVYRPDSSYNRVSCSAAGLGGIACAVMHISSKPRRLTAYLHSKVVVHQQAY